MFFFDRQLCEIVSGGPAKHPAIRRDAASKLSALDFCDAGAAPTFGYARKISQARIVCIDGEYVIPAAPDDFDTLSRMMKLQPVVIQRDCGFARGTPE